MPNVISGACMDTLRGSKGRILVNRRVVEEGTGSRRKLVNGCNVGVRARIARWAVESANSPARTFVGVGTGRINIFAAIFAAIFAWSSGRLWIRDAWLRIGMRHPTPWNAFTAHAACGRRSIVDRAINGSHLGRNCDDSAFLFRLGPIAVGDLFLRARRRQGSLRIRCCLDGGGDGRRNRRAVTFGVGVARGGEKQRQQQQQQSG